VRSVVQIHPDPPTQMSWSKLERVIGNVPA
jgi:hypothetical protein